MSESLTITLPDGSQKSVPAGSSPLDIAKSISPRLADDAIVARVDGDLWDLTRPFEKDAKLEILTIEESGGAAGLPAFHRALAGRRGAGTVSRNQARHRAAHRHRFLLRLPARDPVHAGGSGKTRSAHAGDCRLRDLPFEREVTPKEVGLTNVRGSADEGRVDRGARGRNLLRIHAGAAFHRLLPRAARAVDQEDQGVQAAVHRGRVLEGRRAQPAAAAHLRHGVLHQEGSGRVSATSWKKPRSATIASWARNWTCSASRNWPGRG